MDNKRKRSKNNSSERSGHSKTLNDVANPLADEAHKTIRIVICVLLALATFAIYSEVQDHEFINYDDPTYVTENLDIQAGLSSESISWAFTTFSGGNWSPVTWFSHMLDYQLYGLQAKGHHLTNLFLHITNSLLLFLVLFRMTGALWQSAFVSALFALHPLNVESVAWAAERKNVLSTLFWLMTMWAYINYTQKLNIKSYSLVILFFILGLMSKAMLVTLPFVLLMLDFWPLNRLKFGKERGSSEALEKRIAKKSEVSKLVFEKTPLFLFTIGLSIITFIAQKSLGAMNQGETLTFSTRVTNAMVSYLEYLEKMIWPRGLSIFYPHPGNTLAEWKGILCCIALVGISIISIRLIRKAPYFAIGWFWYLGTLVPVIGIVQVGRQAIADRYAYIPLVGIFIIVAWGVPELLSKWRYKERVLSVSAGIIIFALLITTWKQVSHWKNSVTIFQHAIKVTDIKHPYFVEVYNNLGAALFAEGKNEEAISHYKTALELSPNFVLSHYNLGDALFAQGKNSEAISQYKLAIKSNPDFTDAYNNLGNVLFAEGKNEEAISYYKTALELKSDSADTHYNLGIVLLQKGNTSEAISQFKKVIELKPNFVEVYINLSFIYLNKRNFKLSLKTLNTLESINPDHPILHYNFSCYYALLGNIPKGIDSLKKAITNGYKNYQNLETDPDLESLRQNPQFNELRSLLLAKHS
jgi:protein O-mannosyl-transferase